jgi:hypothetical protein
MSNFGSIKGGYAGRCNRFNRIRLGQADSLKNLMENL